MSELLTELRERARSVGRVHGATLHGLGEDEGAALALSALGEAGLLAYTVPAAFGGADVGELAAADDVSVRALCVLRDELAWHHAMLDFVFVMQGLGSYPIARGGSDALRGEILPRVAKGEIVSAFALTEPDAGSDVAQVATRATRDGSGWRLDGRKTFISNAGVAGFYTVLARTAGDPGDGKGLAMFHVPADAPGVRAERFEVMGPHPIGDVVFESAEVAEGSLLGEEGRGMGLAFANLGRFRTSVAAAANGFARRALDESRCRLSDRVQFGRPLAKNQALRFDVAEMDTRLRAAQLLVEEAANAVDAGETATREVARAKLFSTENASWVCDRAVQHFGGLGVKRGEVVESLYRDVRALRIYEGTSEVQKLIIAKELFDQDA